MTANDFLDRLLALDDEPAAGTAEAAPPDTTPPAAPPDARVPVPSRLLTPALRVANGQDAIAAFRDRFAPVAVTAGYRVKLAAVAALLALSFAVYLAFIVGFAAAGVALARLAGNTHSARFAVALAVTAIGCAWMVWIFVRPLGASFGHRSSAGVPVSSQAEPELYAFVHIIAGLVGAPTPHMILVNGRVNAGAGVLGGLRGVFRRRLVLHLGLPLAAGLTCRQLAGVIAHELGHFSQHGGLRTTTVVRTLEHALAEVYLELRSHVVNAQRASAIVVLGAPKVVLGVLLRLSTFGSRALLREMERDADRYETRLVGSETFAATARRLAELTVAEQLVMRAATSPPERVAAAVLGTHRDLPLETRQAIRKSLDAGRTRWQDTHPSDAERIAQATAEAAPGVYACDLPGSVLFRDFGRLDRMATRAP